MVAPYVTHFERLVSQPRFDKYRPSDQDDLETLVTYLWNAALAEALFQGLSAMEVALRNVVHPTFTTHIGTEYWFQAVLLPEEMKFVNDVWMKLSKRHKRPPTPGKIIAELTFGFWPHLFDSRYHDLWWDNKTSLFRTTFPHIPTNVPPHQSVVLKTIHQRVELCQKLRNRVMHHEPIFTGISILNKPSVFPRRDPRLHYRDAWLD